MLANDSFAPDIGETLRITAVTQPANGTVVITGGGTGLTFKPAANYCRRRHDDVHVHDQRERWHARR